MEKIKNLIKIILALFVLFIETAIVSVQAQTTHKKLAIAHIVKGPKKFDGNHVYFISQLPVDQWQKNDTFQVNDNTFKLYASPSSFIANTEETYNSYRDLRVKGFESLIDWFDFSEHITVVKGSKLKGIKMLANSRSDENGNITYGDFKQIDTSWYFLCYANVPMYKMTGGMEPCLNLTRVMFADDFGKTIPEKPKKVDFEPKDSIIPEKPKLEAKKDMMLEPCSSVEYEMADWYVEGGEQLGKFTKSYSNIYWRKSDNYWLQKNGQKWDTICPLVAKKQVEIPKKNSNSVIEYDCFGIPYVNGVTSPSGEIMFNSGEVIKIGDYWYRKNLNGGITQFCPPPAITKNDQDYYELTKTKYFFPKQEEEVRVVYVIQQAPPAQTTFLQKVENLAFSGYVNFSTDNRNNYNGYQNGYQNNVGYQNGYRNRGQIVQRRDGPFDKHQ